MIWITHVLEHLPDPTELLVKCKEWLKKDGLICIAVPDCENPEMLDASVDNPYHIFHFTKKTLTKIFEKTDWPQSKRIFDGRRGGTIWHSR